MGEEPRGRRERSQEGAAAELMFVGFSPATLSLNSLDFSALTLFTTSRLYVEGQIALCEWGRGRGGGNPPGSSSGLCAPADTCITCC